MRADMLNKKILIVDDDPDFRELMLSYLDEFEVAVVSSGQEALKILRKPNVVDLVFLDLVMPSVGGMDVLEEIKKENPSLRVVMLTAHGTKDSAIEAFRAAADDFVEKGSAGMERIKSIAEDVFSLPRGVSKEEARSTAEKIEKVKRFIERNFSKKTSLEDAAILSCLSPKYFSRVFKEIAGLTFMDYKIKLRINKAKELLKSSHYNIGELAEKLGYENIESFTRQFKKKTGYSPAQFRKVINEKVL